MSDTNNKITETKKVVTRKQAQANPELQKEIIENNTIDAFNRKPKLTRTPPKQNITLENFQNLPSTSKNNLEVKVDDLLNIPEITIAPTSPNAYFTPNQETSTYINDSIFDFENKQGDYTDIEGILNEQSLVLDGRNNKSENKNNQKLLTFDNNDNNNINNNIMANNTLKLPLKEVAKLVPEFDGKNIPIDEYIEKLKQAKNIIADTDEENLVHILKIKLKGDIYKALINSQISRIDELIKAIRIIYPRTDNIYSLYGKLMQLIQDPNESVLQYANKMRELATQIKEMKQLESNVTEQILQTFENQLKQDALKSFKKGLKQEIRIELGETAELDATIKKAIEIETILLNQKMLRSEKANILFNCEKMDLNIPRIFHCQICRDKNHEALFCINAACVYCKSNDHMSYYCKNTKNKLGLICKYCSAQGHSIDTCKLNQTNGNHCQYCQVIGHTAVHCPIITEYELCWKCKESGHDSNTCKRNENLANSCEVCGNTNHTVKNCPSVICQRCNKLGHTMKYCNVTKKMIWCAICNEEDHEASDCESAKVLVMQNKQIAQANKITCQFCNKSGHLAKSCPQLSALYKSTNNYNQNANKGYKKFSGNRETFENNHQSNAQYQKSNLQNIKCDYCKLTGHTIENCRKLQKLEMQVSCSYCKEPGHITDDCSKIKMLENRAAKFCSICKNINHTTEECFKNQNYQQRNPGNE